MKKDRAIRGALLGMLVGLLSSCGGGMAPAGCPCVIFQVDGAGHVDSLVISALDAKGAVLKSADAGAADLPIAIRLAVGTVSLSQLVTVRFTAIRGARTVATVDVAAAALPYDDATFRQQVSLGDVGR